MRVRYLLFTLLFYSIGAQAQSYYDGIRICWDYHSQQYVCGGVYSRLKVLSDGTLVCVYSAGSDVYFRRKRGKNWDQAVKVASDGLGKYNYTNSELLELADGRLMYAWNARSKVSNDVPYKIMAAYSSTKGLTWRDEQTLFVAGTDWNDGCWEPAMMQLASGEVQLFFANEYQVPNKQQNITLLRSLDNCKTWQEPEVVSFRSGSRDGMPVPVCLQNDKGLVFAIEDNGLNGNFKPVIIHSSVKDNWTGGTVTGSSSHRWSALVPTEALASSVYAGAPYLIQLKTGETLLSCQSAEGRPSNDHSIMQVYVGNASAKKFCCRSTPLPFVEEPQTTVLWNGLVQVNDSTVMATSSVGNRTSKNGIWTSTGYIYHPLTALHRAGGTVDWNALPVGMFIGAESQAQAKVRSLWDEDSLYVHFQVNDATLVDAAESGLAEDADGVELYIDKSKRGGETVSNGLFKVLATLGGAVQFKRSIGSRWFEYDSKSICHVSREENGYSVLMALPWSELGGKPSAGDLALFFRLNNNDNTGLVFHENMSGGNPEKPVTWIRCTLSKQVITAIIPPSLSPLPEAGIGDRLGSIYSLGGQMLGCEMKELPSGLYVSKGRKMLK